MAESDSQALAHPEYWDRRYTESDGEVPTHEWFRSFIDLKPFLQKHLFDSYSPGADPQILHLGSGDSTLPVELQVRGYTRQMCVDFSAVVVKLMAARHSKLAGIEWRHADVRNMASLADQSVEVALDKGTLDAMIHGSPWDPPDDVRSNTKQYLNEVHRLLKRDGAFLYVTFRQPHFIMPLLEQAGPWQIERAVLGEGGSFGYYGYVVKKRNL